MCCGTEVAESDISYSWFHEISSIKTVHRYLVASDAEEKRILFSWALHSDVHLCTFLSTKAFHDVCA